MGEFIWGYTIWYNLQKIRFVTDNVFLWTYPSNGIKVHLYMNNRWYRRLKSMKYIPCLLCMYHSRSLKLYVTMFVNNTRRKKPLFDLSQYLYDLKWSHLTDRKVRFHRTIIIEIKNPLVLNFKQTFWEMIIWYCPGDSVLHLLVFRIERDNAASMERGVQWYLGKIKHYLRR